MEYRDSRGNVRREYVSAECLADSADGLARCPVTLEHPDGEVDASNVDTLGVGDVDGLVEQERRGGFVRVKLAVRRKDALDAVRAGKVELSPGYRVQIDPTPGEHPVYGRYDCSQVRREYNHLAIVDTARGGHEVRLRTDSARVATAAFSLDTGIPPASPTTTGRSAPGGAVKPIIVQLVAALGLSQRRYDTDDLALEACHAAIVARKDNEATDAEKVRKDAEEGQRRLTELQAKCDDLQKKLDDATAANAEMKKKAEEEEEKKDRASLEPLAKALKVDSAKHPKIAELRKAIATAHMGGSLRADATDAYVVAVVDLAKQAHERADDKGGGRQAGREAWAPQHNDGVVLNQRAIETGGQGSQKQPEGFAAKSRSRWDSAFAEAHGNGGGK